MSGQTEHRVSLSSLAPCGTSHHSPRRLCWRENHHRMTSTITLSLEIAVAVLAEVKQESKLIIAPARPRVP